MYICPECGTEYAVVPDACTVCGHEPADTEHIDLFAAAAAQERKAAEQQSKRQQEYQTRAAAAQESEELPEADPVPKQDSGTLPDSGAVPSGKKKSRTALKAAALCTATALVMGGGAYWGFMRGEPAGFQKTAFSTFYLKDNDLWYQNGQTAKTLCLSNELIKSDGYMSDSDISSASYFLDSMLTVSADGTDLYYPKQLDIEHISEQQCFTLMHCTAEHPEEAEEIADIRLTESLYAMAWSNSALLRSVYSSSFQSNSYLSNEPALYDMNPMYLLCGDAVYHRNQNGEFCCTRNGETEVIAPIVERFWTVPDQERVYYITIPDYDEYKERMQVREPLDAYRPDRNCMNSEAIVTKTDGGYEQQLHSADYALFATAPASYLYLVSFSEASWNLRSSSAIRRFSIASSTAL